MVVLLCGHTKKATLCNQEAFIEIKAKSILSKSGIPGAEYVINPYAGCTHGCLYCYARFMKRFLKHDQAWGTFADPKINAAQLLREQLSKRRSPIKGTVFLSSVTDCYLPAEKKYGLTRSVLEVLLEYQVAVSILTKSDLVLRDIDLLKQFKDCSVGLSLSSTDEAFSKLLEPRASSPQRRIEALHTLHAAGIDTYAFISPYLPGFSDFEEMFRQLKGKVNEIGIEAINLRAADNALLQNSFIKQYPERAEIFWKNARDKNYWNKLEEQAKESISAAGISFMGLFCH